MIDSYFVNTDRCFAAESELTKSLSAWEGWAKICLEARTADLLSYFFGCHGGSSIHGEILFFFSFQKDWILNVLIEVLVLKVALNIPIFSYIQKHSIKQYELWHIYFIVIIIINNFAAL